MDTSNTNKKAAARIDAQDLGHIAARAVERAQAARQGFTELSTEQAESVSGGITASGGVSSSALVIKQPVIVGPCRPPIIYGGFPLPVDILQQKF